MLAKQLFSLVDYYKNETSTVAVCLHIGAFNNILYRTIISSGEVQIIHDEINELSDTLLRAVENFNELNGTNITFDFRKSYHNLFI